MRFRFDDVCINADVFLINDITDLMLERFPGCEVIFGVSPLVHDMSHYNLVERQRVFPKILNAHSDYRIFYNVQDAGTPDNLHIGATLAGHGIVHVDHRLLSKEAQEMSILISSSLVNSKIFIPPFNKWNKDTEAVCRENEIELIKFEDGWLSMEHNKFNPQHRLWYLHAREWTMEKIKQYFNA